MKKQFPNYSSKFQSLAELENISNVDEKNCLKFCDDVLVELQGFETLIDTIKGFKFLKGSR